MHRLGIGLMAFGAVATLALIGMGEQGSFAILGLGAGALAVCFVGCMLFARGRTALAQTARFDEMADDAQSEARIHLLEGRETELVRQVASLESRRDEILAELAAAVGGTGRPGTIDVPPTLIVVPEPD
jgi:hypothetical protein